jgi:hypothetical protein
LPTPWLEIHVTDDIDTPAYTLSIAGQSADRFQDLTWERTGDPLVPYRTVVDGVRLRVEAGDYPAENMYVLIVGDIEAGRFDVMPSNWHVSE